MSTVSPATAGATGASVPVAAPRASAEPGNRLLAMLTAKDAAWVAPRLMRVTLALGDRFAVAGRPLAHVYFPESAIASVIAVMDDGGSVEVGTVGDEGMVGLSAFFGVDATTSEIVCQIPGTALRLPAADLARAADERPAFRRLLNRYADAYLAQVSQAAACNRLHPLERRCARWLLMTHDRVHRADRFPLTQEYLAMMLGVRRAGVSVAAGHLQSAGLIRYHRGGVQVLDRAGLEAASCECYRVVRARLDQLLSGGHPGGAAS